MKLTSIRLNEPYEITHIEESEIKNRLYEMGVFPSQTLTLIKKALFGDPLVVQVDDQLIMLRQIEADFIILKER